MRLKEYDRIFLDYEKIELAVERIGEQLPSSTLFIS